jgi:hypothetical protein
MVGSPHALKEHFQGVAKKMLGLNYVLYVVFAFLREGYFF